MFKIDCKDNLKLFIQKAVATNESTIILKITMVYLQFSIAFNRINEIMRYNRGHNPALEKKNSKKFLREASTFV